MNRYPKPNAGEKRFQQGQPMGRRSRRSGPVEGSPSAQTSNHPRREEKQPLRKPKDSRFRRPGTHEKRLAPSQGMSRFRRFNPDEKRLKPTQESMNFLLKKAEIELNREQLTQLWTFHNLLRQRNDDRDLTRIIGFEPMIIKHYIDSMIIGKMFPLPSPLVDVGTGAGFPGIPLKIRFPHLKIILAEPRPRRIAFLKEAIHELRLRNVEVFEHKVVSQSFTTPVKGVISRALEEIEKTVLRTSAALEKGGHLIFLKGPAVDPEIDAALKRFPGGLKLVLHKKFKLPLTGHERRLVVFEKTGDVSGLF